MATPISILALAFSFGVVPGESPKYSNYPLFTVITGRVADSNKSEGIPITFSIPANFSRHQFAANADTLGVIFATKEDLGAILNSGNPETGYSMKTKNGLFRISPSLNVFYNASTNHFSAEESQDTAQLAAAGFKDIVLKRSDTNKIPVLISTCNRSGRYSFIAYIAISPPGHSTIKITYTHPDPFTENDRETWFNFVNNLGK